MPASVFTQENFARLDLVIAQHKGEQGALMPVLYEAKKNIWLYKHRYSRENL
jgi:hypothetical protein